MAQLITVSAEHLPWQNTPRANLVFVRILSLPCPAQGCYSYIYEDTEKKRLNPPDPIASREFPKVMELGISGFPDIPLCAGKAP